MLSFMQELNQIYIITYSAFCNRLLIRTGTSFLTPILPAESRRKFCHIVVSHLSRVNSQRGSSGRSYSGIGSSCAELRRVVMRTSGVLEFMEELESADTYRSKEIG